ncbi:hypothetical protein [Paraburkholderia fynbosensis]|uniref:Uncharacterized protein n=1 Tax=Paraburkholderia fynbosensis TaxID=1200993 RepID=A0A6J5GHZ2_9BURK|nr:hypothetical protein [Paraburkholderia fynbosensis]CAB3801242.1 hypothetical protein LMG27177_05006 [Paraburkholderia fynbosensis]
MPKKPTGGSPGNVRSSRRETTLQLDAAVPHKASRSKQKAASEAIQQQPLALALEDEATVAKVRRDNLHVLTGRNGSKARLGVVMSMSGSNMAHRLYGKKRMDSVEANRFTERLGLPAGWLDTPRSEAEIPESVSCLLTPASRGREPVERQEPLATASSESLRETAADAKVEVRGPRPRPRTSVASALESASPVSADSVEANGISVSRRNHSGDASDEPAGRHAANGDSGLPSVPAAKSEPPPVAATSHQDPVTQPASATSLDNLHGIAPIAEALIKTLAGKARTGRLDELKALELLQQAVLL